MSLKSSRRKVTARVKTRATAAKTPKPQVRDSKGRFASVSKSPAPMNRAARRQAAAKSRSPASPRRRGPTGINPPNIAGAQR